MARGVEYRRSKTIVKLAALELFLDEFEPEIMIDALIALCELAVSHPEFGEGDHPDSGDYDLADQATDILSCFFLIGNCVEEDATGAPRAVIDWKRGALDLMRKRYRRRKREPMVRAATAPVGAKLSSRPHAQN